jgi:hypothetical protein
MSYERREALDQVVILEGQVKKSTQDFMTCHNTWHGRFIRAEVRAESLEQRLCICARNLADAFVDLGINEKALMRMAARNKDLNQKLNIFRRRLSSRTALMKRALASANRSGELADRTFKESTIQRILFDQWNSTQVNTFNLTMDQLLSYTHHTTRVNREVKADAMCCAEGNEAVYQRFAAQRSIIVTLSSAMDIMSSCVLPYDQLEPRRVDQKAQVEDLMEQVAIRDNIILKKDANRSHKVGSFVEAEAQSQGS